MHGKVVLVEPLALVLALALLLVLLVLLVLRLLVPPRVLPPAWSSSSWMPYNSIGEAAGLGAVGDHPRPEVGGASGLGVAGCQTPE